MAPPDDSTQTGPPEGGGRPLVVLGSGEQAVSVPFTARVVGRGAPETIRVAAGADVQASVGTGDAVRLPGSLDAYNVSASGNTLALARADGTQIRMAVNAATNLVFDDGGVTADLEPVADQALAVTLDGKPIDAAFDPNQLSPTPVSDLPSGVPSTPNSVFLSGGGRPVTVPFNAEVVGTGAAETVRVPAGARVRFSGNSGDRLELEKPLSAYDVSASGNQAVFQAGETRATLGLNGPTEVAFADGSATADIAVVEGQGVRMTLGGEPLGDGFTAAEVTLDADDASTFPGDGADDGGDDGDDDGDDGADDDPPVDEPALPARPSGGGPAPMQAGTALSQNIEGNQDGRTVRGNGGADRFVFDPAPTQVEIADFAPGDQLFFTGGVRLSDVAVANAATDDGSIQLTAGPNDAVHVSLTGLDAATDAGIGGTVAGFVNQMGVDSLRFGRAASNPDVRGDATAEVDVRFDARTDGFFAGVRDDIRETLTAAWRAWESNLDMATRPDGAPVDVEIAVEQPGRGQVGDPAPLAATAPLARPEVPTVATPEAVDGRPVHRPGLVQELRTGTDPNGDSADVRIALPNAGRERIAYRDDTGDPLPGGEFDGITVFTHELGHALGIDGTTTFDADIASAYDQHLVPVPGGDGFRFDGPAVREATGGPVGLDTDDPFHLADSASLMDDQQPRGEHVPISTTELAMLEDAGVPVSDAALASGEDGPDGDEFITDTPELDSDFAADVPDSDGDAMQTTGGTGVDDDPLAVV